MKVTKKEASILSNVLYSYKYDNIRKLTIAEYEFIDNLEFKLDNYVDNKPTKKRIKL